MIEYLVDSIFVEVGNMVFRQCVGIPTYRDRLPSIVS